jgi:dienelactone hydrolase
MRPQGDGLPVQLLQRNSSIPIDDHDWSAEEKAKVKALDINEWTKKHPQDRIQTLLGSVITSLREESPALPLFGVGYCFGGKYAFILAKGALKAAVAFHPVRFCSHRVLLKTPCAHHYDVHRVL